MTSFLNRTAVPVASFGSVECSGEGGDTITSLGVRDDTSCPSQGKRHRGYNRRETQEGTVTNDGRSFG